MKLRSLPVDVIGWFDFKGELRPVSFRFDIGGETFNGRILKIQDRHTGTYTGSRSEIMTCNVEIEGRNTLAEFKYEIDNHKWFLYKM